MELIRFEENSVSMKKCLLNIFDNFGELDNEIYLERSDMIFIHRYKFGNCNIKLECCKELPAPILLLLNEVKALIPEFSIQKEHYEAFLIAIDAPQLRGSIRIEKEDIEKINDQLGTAFEANGSYNKENYLTCLVFALWKKLDNIAEALIPHLMIHDIVPLCKIYKLNS